MQMLSMSNPPFLQLVICWVINCSEVKCSSWLGVVDGFGIKTVVETVVVGTVVLAVLVDVVEVVVVEVVVVEVVVEVLVEVLVEVDVVVVVILVLGNFWTKDFLWLARRFNCGLMLVTRTVLSQLAPV